LFSNGGKGVLSGLLRRVLGRLLQSPEVRQVWIDQWIPSTFGQLGEDAVIANNLGWLGLPTHAAGMYLDIGAHHPTSGSNTYSFYRQGARGIAVDIGPRKQQLWQRFCPRDQFINAAVMPNSYAKDSVAFQISGTYGSAGDHVEGYGVITNPRGRKTIHVSALRAGDLAQQVLALPAWLAATWRVLNVDIEGLDDQVLQDLNVERLRPDVVAVESFLPREIDLWQKIAWYVHDSPVVKAMEASGYSLQSICGPTLVFVRKASRTSS